MIVGLLFCLLNFAGTTLALVVFVAGLILNIDLWDIKFIKIVKVTHFITLSFCLMGYPLYIIGEKSHQEVELRVDWPYNLILFFLDLMRYIVKQNGKIKKRDLIKKILVDGDLITIEKLLETTGCTEEDVKKWKAGRKIICVDIYGKELFAAYCIDRDSGVPINGISDLISKLPFQKTSLAVAAWFSSENALLGGVKPKCLIKSDFNGIMRAAEIEFSKTMEKKSCRVQ